MAFAARAAVLVLAALAAKPALACGHCIEDRVAAVFDYAVLTRSFERDDKVAFFAIDGVLVPRDADAIRAIAQTTRGVDKASVRVSADLGSVSFAFNSRQSLAELQKRIEHRLKSRGLALMPLRVMDRHTSAGR